MASFRSVATASIENNDTVTVTKPTGLTAGDLMIAFCFSTGNSGATDWDTPSGWTLKITDVGDSEAMYMSTFSKIADSSDAAASNFSFTHTDASSTTHSVVLYAISGTFTSAENIVDISSDAGIESEDDLPVFTPGITPQPSSLLIMWAGGRVLNSSTSNLSGYAIATSNPTWTERADFAVSADEDQRVGSATATRTESTATGDFQVDFNSNGNLSEAIGVLLSVSDTSNNTFNADPLVLTGTLPNPTVTGDSNTTLTPLIITGTLPEETHTQEIDPWTNTNKSASGTWTNQSKN